MQLGVVLALAFAVAIAIFAGQNTTPVALNFLFSETVCTKSGKREVT